MDLSSVEFDDVAVQLDEAAATPTAALQAPELAGRRRWAQGAWKHDRRYWTFEEYRAFALEVGLGEQGALDMWRDSLDEVAEALQVQENVTKVRLLPAVSIQEISRGINGILLELVHGSCAFDGAVGLCLRLLPHSKANCWGGVQRESLLSIDVVEALPSLQVHIRAATGAYLHVANDGSLGFRYVDAGEHPCTFELFPRAGAQETLVTVAAVGAGTILGTFVPRRSPAELTVGVAGATETPWCFEAQLAAAARRLAVTDSSLGGRKRHLQDASFTYYSFEEMAIYVQRLFQPSPPDGALELARALWLHACVAEEAVEQAEDQEWEDPDENHDALVVEPDQASSSWRVLSSVTEDVEMR